MALLDIPDSGGERIVTLDQRPAPDDGQRLARLGLTRREIEVLEAAARGLREQDIASTMAISRRTVNKHLEHAYRKLDVTDRARAIVVAFGGRRPAP